MKTEVKEKIDALVQNISALGTQDGQAASDRLLSELTATTATPEERKEAGEYLRREMRLRRKCEHVDVAGPA